MAWFDTVLLKTSYYQTMLLCPPRGYLYITYSFRPFYARQLVCLGAKRRTQHILFTVIWRRTQW